MIISFVYAYKSDVSTQKNFNTEFECHSSTRYSILEIFRVGTRYSVLERMNVGLSDLSKKSYSRKTAL